MYVFVSVCIYVYVCIYCFMYNNDCASDIRCIVHILRSNKDNCSFKSLSHSSVMFLICISVRTYVCLYCCCFRFAYRIVVLFLEDLFYWNYFSIALTIVCLLCITVRSECMCRCMLDCIRVW